MIVPAGDAVNSLMVTLPALNVEAGKTYTVVYTLKSGGPVELSGAVLRSEKDDARATARRLAAFPHPGGEQ